MISWTIIERDILWEDCYDRRGKKYKVGRLRREVGLHGVINATFSRSNYSGAILLQSATLTQEGLAVQSLRHFCKGLGEWEVYP